MLAWVWAQTDRVTGPVPIQRHLSPHLCQCGHGRPLSEAALGRLLVRGVGERGFQRRHTPRMECVGRLRARAAATPSRD